MGGRLGAIRRPDQSRNQQRDTNEVADQGEQWSSGEKPGGTKQVSQSDAQQKQKQAAGGLADNFKKAHS